MPMFPFSRYAYCLQLEDAAGIKYLDEREPFAFREETDNRYYRTVDGDTWYGMAHTFFDGIPRACGLWWVLCDFQPERVIDPTLRIEPNTLIVVPSIRLIRTKLFTNDQRRFH